MSVIIEDQVWVSSKNGFSIRLVRPIRRGLRRRREEEVADN